MYWNEEIFVDEPAKHGEVRFDEGEGQKVAALAKLVRLWESLPVEKPLRRGANEAVKDSSSATTSATSDASSDATSDATTSARQKPIRPSNATKLAIITKHGHQKLKDANE